MYKIFFTCIFALFLASCGNNSDKTADGTPITTITGSGFEMGIPSNWTATGSSLELPSHINGQIVVEAVSPDKKYNFSPNLMVISEQLDYAGSSKQYSELNNISTQKKYSEYGFVSSDIFLFDDSDEGKYFVFDAKYNSKTPKLRFIQSAKMCGTTVYFFNVTTGLDADAKKFANIFKTFRCK